MSTILGILDLNDNERVFINTIGQSVVYDALMQVLGDHNMDMDAMVSVFVERTTTDHTIRYKLPGNGYLQERFSGGGETTPRLRKVTGSWDVAFPLRDFGDSVGGDDVALAYMSAQDFDLHVQGVLRADVNTMRDRILGRVFVDDNTTFVDPIYGSLTIRALANQDGTLYPPVIGTVSEAERQRYVISGYTAASIDDTNNPYRTIVQALEGDFGKRTGNSNVVTFINSAQVAVTEDLTDFIPVPDNFVIVGDNVTTPTNLPANLPGRVIGRSNGTWIVEWDWIPANYMLALHLEAPKPLYQRVDEEGTGLPTGLALVGQNDLYPLQDTTWRRRYGIGTANRLNGYVIQFKASGTYDIPAAYPEP